jgi:hypothetical protein
VLPLVNGCEKCHTSPEIVNFPMEWEIDSVCPNCSAYFALDLLRNYPFVSK